MLNSNTVLNKLILILTIFSENLRENYTKIKK